MSIPGTGRVVRTESGRKIEIVRTFRASIDDVWQCVVDSEKLDRWIGSWSGDPATGHVTFVMTAEGSEVEEPVTIHACEAPRFLDVETAQGGGTWRMSTTLSEEAGITTLVFTQDVVEGEDFSSFGIGWEYYLDRLVAVLAGDSFAAWEDYYPAQEAYWKEADLTSQP